MNGNNLPADAQITIKINGTKVSPEFMRALTEVTVDTNLHLPAMFTLRLWDSNAEWTDNTTLLKIGQPVEISVKAASQGGRSGSTATLIKGEITSLEPQFESFGSVILNIVGYDKAHRLHRGRKTRTFLKMTDSSIVSQLAQEAGLTASVDATSIQNEYILQHNRSDWEFLQERAARVGYRLYVNDQTLYFKKSDTSPPAAPDLTWGEDLLRFQPRLTALQQSETVLVKGWNPKTKQGIVGRATTKTLVPQTGLGTDPGSAVGSFGAAEWVNTTSPVATQDEAQAMANALSNDASGRAIHAEGEALGEPQLVAGKKVKIEGIGTRFGGTYTVTAATHHYESDGTYTTRFTVSGREANTLYNLLSTGATTTNRIDGVVIGVVTNNNDSENKGRVKVKFPWLSDEDESNWARIAAPMAGASRGFFFMPEVNDEVLVAFEHGDVNYPYVVGALWNGKDAPPLSTYVANGKVTQRILQTTSGHQIILTDKAGEESIKIVDKTGKNSILIDSTQNSITVQAERDINVKCKGKMGFEAAQDITMESKTGKVIIKGTGGAEMTTPAQLKLAGTGGAEVSSTATMTVKGSIVQVQGSGPTMVKGNPIMLN